MGVEWLRVDDPVGAVSVHGFCGLWGTLSLGTFACRSYGVTGPCGADNSAPLLFKGLLYVGGVDILKAQAIGTFTIAIAGFVVTYVMMYLINKLPHLWRLRVEEKGEIGVGGLDIFDNGMVVYPPQDEDINLGNISQEGLRFRA